ncbi:unnamed protein product [Porites lobata]|uniref:Uncharacterized protein n=1 Tax=Porites lobata TaxID=104759 RepID=A0ABN8NKZ1_9CNID|nr:unnamed protein product [Porites lobata]
MDKFLNSIPVTSKSDLSPGQQEPIYSSTQLNGAQPTFSLPRVENGVHSTLSPSATPFQPHSVVLEKCMDKLVETSSMLVAATMEQNLQERDCPGKEVLQYAVLDDQSNVSFVSQKFV